VPAFGSDGFLGCFDGAATLMTEHKDQAHRKVVHSILNAPQA
jgi:hypothetical protein